jgi:hypothetical protein
MLLLAGLAAPAVAAEPAKPEAKVAASAEAQAPYVGVNVLPLTPGFRERDLRLELPEGVGIVVGLVDPEGPAAGKLQEKDVLTRLDDQVLVNADQFRTLVRTRKPGQAVKLVRVRGDEVDTVELTLAGRPAARAFTARGARPADLAMPEDGGIRITVNGQEIDPSQMIGGGAVTFGQGGPGGRVVIVGPGAQGLPEEIRRQLAEMRQRGLPIPDLEAGELAPDDVLPPPAAASGAGQIQGRRVTTFSRSFALGSGGPGVSSSSAFADEEGTVQVRKEGGKTFANVKTADGQVLFDGEISTKEQRDALSETVRARIARAEEPGIRIPGLMGDEPEAKAAPGADAPKAGATYPKPRRKIDPREGA